MLLPDDVLYRIWKTYYTNHVLPNIKNTFRPHLRPLSGCIDERSISPLIEQRICSWARCYVHSFQPFFALDYECFREFTNTRPDMPWIWLDEFDIMIDESSKIDRSTFWQSMRSTFHEVSMSESGNMGCVRLEKEWIEGVAKHHYPYTVEFKKLTLIISENNVYFEDPESPLISKYMLHIDGDDTFMEEYNMNYIAWFRYIY